MRVYHRIKYMVVVVGQACSLKCKHCANFAPYAPKDTLMYDYKGILKDLKILFRHVGVIYRLQIQGGEAFCHPHLKEIVEYILDSNKVDHLDIATNGTLLPNGDLIELLKDKRVTLRVSNYQAALGAEKICALTTFCNEHKINCCLYEFASGEGMWYNMGGLSDDYDLDLEAAEDRFSKCAFRGCLTLERHRMGWCSRSTISPLVQNFSPGKDDYFEVKRKINFAKKLETYLRHKKVMQACRYCLGTNGEKIIAGEQLKIGTADQ